MVGSIDKMRWDIRKEAYILRKEDGIWRRFGLVFLLMGTITLAGCSTVSLESFKRANAAHLDQDDQEDHKGDIETPVVKGDPEVEGDKNDESTEANDVDTEKGNEESDGPIYTEIPSSDPQEQPVNESPEPAPPGTTVRTFYELSGTPPTAPGLAMKHRFFKEEPPKIVYLTIDDGPSENTAPILEILRNKGVNATFFVIGTQVEKYPDLLKQAYEQGNAIGNHTYSHNYSEIYKGPEAFVANLKKNEELIYKLIGIKPKVIRTPGGTHGNFHVNYYNAVDKEDYLVYDWNVSTGDATAPLVSVETIIRNVKEQVPGRDRIILLMHDAPGKRTSVEALPTVIQFLKEQGYEFGVLSPEVAPILFPGGFYS